jgi:hypothetical protein
MRTNKVQSAPDNPPVPRQPRAVTLKLDPSVLDEIDELLGQLEKHPDFRAFAMSRQTVIRLAIEAGLPVLRRKASSEQ